MKRLIVTALLIAILGMGAQAQPPKATKTVATTPATPTTWNVDASHSSVKFSVTHLTVSETEGIFKKFNGSINSKTADFQGATINFTVDVNSINTDDDARDKHLKGVGSPGTELEFAL